MMLYIIATKTWKRAQTRGNILVKLRPWESHDCGKREWSRNLFTMSLWQLLVWEFRGNTFQSARLSSFSRLTWLLGGTPEAQTLKSVALLSHGQKLRCFRPFQSFLGEIWNLWWLYTNQTFWNIWTHISHHLINNSIIYPLGLMEPQPGSGFGLGDNSRILGVVVLWPWSVCHLQLLGMAVMVPGMGYDWGANGHQLGIFWSFWMVPTINYFRDNFDGYADTQLLSVLSRESDQLGPHFIRQ